MATILMLGALHARRMYDDKKVRTMQGSIRFYFFCEVMDKQLRSYSVVGTKLFN